MSLPPVYSQRLFTDFHVGPGYSTNVWAPPDGYLWVIKCVTFFSPAPAAVNTLFMVDGDTGGQYCGAVYASGANANYTVFNELAHVVQGASTVQCFSTLALSTFMASGFLLQAP